MYIDVGNFARRNLTGSSYLVFFAFRSALCKEMLILEENLAAKAKELAARDATIAQQKAIEMRKIMESQLVTEDRIMREFEDDWQKMDNPVFQVRSKAYHIYVYFQFIASLFSLKYSASQSILASSLCT